MLTALAVAAALVALGYWPTVRVGGTGAVGGLLAGVAVALVGAWAGSLPTILYSSRPPQQHATGILLGLGVRFGVTVALMLVVWLGSGLPRRPLLLWVGIAQLVLLLVDVLGLVALLKRATRKA